MKRWLIKSAVFISCLGIGFYLWGGEEPLDVSRVTELSVEQSSSLKLADMELNKAFAGYKLKTLDAYPQFNLDLGSSYNQDHTLSLTGYEDQRSGVVTGSLGISQLIPSGGTLSLALADSLAFTTVGSADSISQAPTLSLNLNQPLFVNGKFIDPELYSAGFKLARSGWDKAILSKQQIKNSMIYQVLTHFFDIILLKKRIENLSMANALSEKDLQALKLLFKRGEASYKDLWEKESLLEDAKKQLLELKDSLLELELRLFSFFGWKETQNSPSYVDTIDFSQKLPELKELLPQSWAANPQLEEKQDEIEQARLSAILDGLNYGVGVDIFFNLSPYYPFQRQNSDSFSSSFSDYGEEGAGLDWSLGFKVSIPINNFPKGSVKQKVNEIPMRMAEENLRITKESIRHDLLKMLAQRATFEKKIDYYRSQVDFEKKRLHEAEELYNLQRITELDVDRARVRLMQKNQDLWEAKAKLFLNYLYIMSLAGKDLEEIVRGLKEEGD